MQAFIAKTTILIFLFFPKLTHFAHFLVIFDMNTL